MEYPTVIVSNIGPDSASMQAAKERWGLTGREWAAIAGDIDVRRLGKTLKPRCRRCCKEIAEPGLCPDCQKAEDYLRREKARIRTTDRRAMYRGD